MSSNKLDLFFLNIPVDQYKENPRKRRGTTPRGKPVRQCGPAIGLCRKMLIIAVGGIFEHKSLFNWRYPVRWVTMSFSSVFTHFQTSVKPGNGLTPWSEKMPSILQSFKLEIRHTTLSSHLKFNWANKVPRHALQWQVHNWGAVTHTCNSLSFKVFR